MRALNKVDLELGENDVPIAIYSAVDKETSLKQISSCCGSAVQYKRVCSGCSKELDFSEIKKALEVGDELKEVNTEKIKVESGNLKILGIVERDDEENGFFKDGLVWFISYENDKKNKAKTERSLIKFSYLRETLRGSNKCFIGLISQRGKEHIVLLKPYFKGIVGVGIYPFDRIRDINELAISDFQTDKEIVGKMVENLNKKESVNIKDIENKREKLLIQELEKHNGSAIAIEQKVENPIELVSF